MDLKKSIRIVENFPKPGISFKDITTLISDGEAFKYSIDAIAEHLKDKNVDILLGPEPGGFIFGVPVAYALGVGFIPVRKKGKLPFETISVNYDLEYGTDVLEIHKDAIKKGQRVAIVDDLLATGGTIEAVTRLVEEAGAKVGGIGIVIEKSFQPGRAILDEKGYDVYSLARIGKLGKGIIEFI